MKILSLLLLLVSAASADVGGSGNQSCGGSFVVYSNSDTTNPVTFDFGFTVNGVCGATVTWTDSAGISQSLSVPMDVPNSASTRGARITLPAAGGSAPAAITVTFDAGSQTVQYSWRVERVN